MQEELKLYDDTRKLSYDELKGSPAGIDLTRKEVCIELIVIKLLLLCLHADFFI